MMIENPTAPLYPQGKIAVPDAMGAAGNGVITPATGSPPAGGSFAGTDDTAVIYQAILNALGGGGASAIGASGTVLLGPHNYLFSAAPSTAFGGNAMLPLPTFGLGSLNNLPLVSNFGTLTIQGVPGQTKLLMNRTDAYSATKGPVSLIGGPTPENTGSSNPGQGIPLRLVIKDLDIILLDAPTVGAIDGTWLPAYHYEGLRIMTTSTIVFSSNGPASLPGVSSFGILAPTGAAVEARCWMSDCLINGVYMPSSLGPHSVIGSVAQNYVGMAHGFDSRFFTAGAQNAPSTLLYSITTGALTYIGGWTPASGAVSLPAASTRNLMCLVWEVAEAGAGPFQPSAFAVDANSAIVGAASQQRFGGPFYLSSPNLTGKSPKFNVRMIDPSSTVGTATLAAGTVTVTPPQVSMLTATTRIRCGILTPGGTVGAPFVATLTAGTSFVIKSTSATDTSVVWWEIWNPGP